MSDVMEHTVPDSADMDAVAPEPVVTDKPQGQPGGADTLEAAAGPDLATASDEPWTPDVVSAADAAAARDVPPAPEGSFPPHKVEAQSIIEAILFASDSPLSGARIAQVLGVGDARDVRQHVSALNQIYADTGRSFRIAEIAQGYQMMTLPGYNAWLSKLHRARNETRLSPAAMETLAIIAYKQPVLRADVEAIRGVACGDVINRLREMNLVKIVGRAEEIGRPMLYGTTRRFLETFGIAALTELPKAEELAPPAPRPVEPRTPE